MHFLGVTWLGWNPPVGAATPRLLARKSSHAAPTSSLLREPHGPTQPQQRQLLLGVGALTTPTPLGIAVP